MGNGSIKNDWGDAVRLAQQSLDQHGCENGVPGHRLTFDDFDAITPSATLASATPAPKDATPRPPEPSAPAKRKIPKSVRLTADNGISLRQSVSSSHKMPLEALHQYCNDYVAYLRTKPAIKDQYTKALQERADLFAERSASDAQEAIAALELELGMLQSQDTIKLMQVRAPEPVRMHGMISELVFPVADAADFLIKFVPVVGQVVAGTEAVTGRSYMGFGADLPDDWRVMDGALAIVPMLGPIVRGGAAGARTVVEIAARTHRTTAEVLRSFERLMVLEPDLVALRAASAKVARGEALSSLEMQAYRRAANILDDIRGTAQHTRFRGENLMGKLSDPDRITYGAWRKNPTDTPARDVAGAQQVLAEQGIDVPPWVRIVKEERIVDRSVLQGSEGQRPVSAAANSEAETFADYPFSQDASRKALSGQRLSFNDLLEPDGTLLVRVRADVFESDEALVAVLSHELHELNNLERAFAELETMSPSQLRQWVHPSRGQNLHGQAWDVADLRVLLMRAETEAERTAIQARLDALLERFERLNFK